MNERADDRATAEEKRWRRRSLGLLVILLPLVAGVVAYDSAQRWWTGRDLIAREIAAGATADFGGARWRLHALRMAPLPASAGVPENAMGVVADFRVEIHDADLPKNWLGCVISLQDEQGRRWTPTQVLRLPRSDARECIASIYSGAQAGDTLRIRQAYLVPREAADTLRATVTLGPQQPYYLRFAQPPQRVQVK
ncbi:hypothetical protein [Bordetella sp. BOR01]|uniref:hypothetical protein n=1 Tax=Bordetella sp. BOR01 TaxID=2854779 RepID=UPI001C4796DD|nr:hypothetical protein [Bordetella sp. BOR01]MBV7483975.1 hypothetical protein [Bordetella sp. BOR01]